MLLFNLATDDQDPILRFTVDWVRALAARIPNVDVVTMRSGTADLPENVRVYSVGKERGWDGGACRLAEFYRRMALLLHEHSYDACFAHMQELFSPPRRTTTEDTSAFRSLCGTPILILRGCCGPRSERSTG